MKLKCFKMLLNYECKPSKKILRKLLWEKIFQGLGFDLRIEPVCYFFLPNLQSLETVTV